MRWLAALAVMYLTLGRAHATPAPELVTLWIDGAARGDTVILVDGDALWLPAAALCEVRLCRDGGVERDGVRYLPLATLGDSVSARFDRAAGELHVAIDVAALTATAIPLGPHVPAELEHASDASLFLNYAVLGDMYSARMEPVQLGGAAELGISLGGTLAYSAVSLVDTTHVIRGLTSYTVDWRARLVRFVAGDDIVTGGTLGGGGVIGGLHVARDFSIDPYYVSQPTLTQSGVVAAPSTVEVYRDGQLIRREMIPAGPYRVEDFTGTTGGDTKVVVRDAFGLTRAIATSMVVPPASALRPGLSMYDYSIGFVRRLGTASFDYGQPGLLAVHRLGITTALTLGARLEALPDRASTGASAVIVRGRTSLEASAGASTSTHGSGAAVALDVGWHRRALTLAALLRATGARYATLDLAADTDRAVAEAALTASWSPFARASLQVQAAGEHMRDTGDRVRGGVTSSLQLGTDMRVFLSFSTACQANLWTAEAMATLAWSWGTHTTATGSVAGGNGSSLSTTISRALPAATGIGYQASASTGALDTVSARGIAQGELGRAEVSGEYTNGAGHAAVSLAGGVVALGGTVKATRPVQGGFALVRVAESQGVRTYLDNQPIGATDRNGEVVLPELQANYGNRIRIDARDLPLDVSTQSLERTIAPPRRGGVVIELSPRRTLLVRGRLRALRDGAPIDLSYGELTVDHTLRAPIGHDGVFEIEAVRAGHHHGVVEVDGTTCSFELELADAPALVDLGVVRCEVAAP